MIFTKVFAHVDIPFGPFKEGYDYILTKDEDSTLILSKRISCVRSIAVFCALNEITFVHENLLTVKLLHEHIILFPFVNNPMGTYILQEAIRLNDIGLFKTLLQKNVPFTYHEFVVAVSKNRPEMMKMLLYIGCTAACTEHDKIAMELVQYRNRCAKKCMVILGLGKCRGKIQGNNRDVLRLIAKEVWKSILDQ